MSTPYPWPRAVPVPSDPAWRASASYNFVRLPARVVPFAEADDPFAALPRHDTFHVDGFPLSGTLNVDFVTQTPTYTRGPVPVKDYQRLQNETGAQNQAPPRGDFRKAVKNRPTFFHTAPEDEVSFAGRSLRGMIRSLVEIVAFGKIDRVSDTKGERQNAKLPRYQYAPLDYVPPVLRNPDEVDLAEAVFGFVRDAKQGTRKHWGPAGSPYRAYRGRVRVTRARLHPDEQRRGDELYLTPRPIVPPVLGQPKSNTANQHYLTQPDGWARYDYNTPPPKPGGENPETVNRGNKVYHHLGQRTADHLDVEGYGAVTIETDDKLHTQIRPIKDGIRFRFHIHFDNLAYRELGALLWALLLPGHEKAEYRHHLGMGKSLGMGAVHIDRVHLNLDDPSTRYTNWGPNEPLHEGEVERSTLVGTLPTEEVSPEDDSFAAWCVQSFERFLLDELGRAELGRLRDHERIQDLLTLHRWPGFPPSPAAHHPDFFGKHAGVPTWLSQKHRPNTRFMTRQEHSVPVDTGGKRVPFKKCKAFARPVLPTPEAFDGRAGETSTPPSSQSALSPSEVVYQATVKSYDPKREGGTIQPDGAFFKVWSVRKTQPFSKKVISDLTPEEKSKSGQPVLIVNERVTFRVKADAQRSTLCRICEIRRPNRGK